MTFVTSHIVLQHPILSASKNVQILTLLEFDKIRRVSYILRDDSNGEIRFVIRDLKNFRFLPKWPFYPFFENWNFLGTYNNKGDGPILYQQETEEWSWEQRFRDIQQEISHMKEAVKGRAPVSIDALVQKTESPFTAGVLCKTRENSNFLKKGKMVISVKIRIFLDFG